VPTGLDWISPEVESLLKPNCEPAYAVDGEIGCEQRRTKSDEEGPLLIAAEAVNSG
jgi:hypothetical protein